MTLKPETMTKMSQLLTRADEEQLRYLNELLIGQLKIIRRQKAFENSRKITIGTRVRVVNSIRPKYLAGQPGEVIDLKGDNVEVKLDCGPINRFRTGTVIFRNASAVEVL